MIVPPFPFSREISFLALVKLRASSLPCRLLILGSIPSLKWVVPGLAATRSALLFFFAAFGVFPLTGFLPFQLAFSSVRPTSFPRFSCRRERFVTVFFQSACFFPTRRKTCAIPSACFFLYEFHLFLRSLTRLAFPGWF